MWSSLKKIIRFYLVPILAILAAVYFWLTYRDQSKDWWWLALIALITLANYFYYFLNKKQNGAG